MSDGTLFVYYVCLFIVVFAFVNVDYFTHACSKPIADVLAKNPSLQVLELSDNILRTDGILALCRAFKTNTNLRSLCLKQNIYDLDSELSLQEVRWPFNPSMMVSFLVLTCRQQSMESTGLLYGNQREPKRVRYSKDRN
jgi:hypothetical protein